MSTRLPTDSNDVAIPALRLKPGATHSISTSASSTRNSVAPNLNAVIKRMAYYDSSSDAGALNSLTE